MRFWKRWPYWVRGGCIAILLVFVSVCLLYVSFPDRAAPGDDGPHFEVVVPFLVITVAALPFALINWLLSELIGDAPVAYLIFVEGFTVYFLVGAFFGWIYGKIKNIIKLKARR